MKLDRDYLTISDTFVTGGYPLYFGERKSAVNFKRVLKKLFDPIKGVRKMSETQWTSNALYKILIDDEELGALVSMEDYEKACEMIANINTNKLYRYTK